MKNDDRYWIVAWGDKGCPTFRGPYDKSSLEKACKDAYGMVAANMMAIDIGTRIAPMRVDAKRRKLIEAARLRFKSDRGVFSWNFNTQELVKLGDWKDEPYIRMFKSFLEQRDARLPVEAQIE